MTRPPGSSAAWPYRAATAEYSAPGEKWNRASTSTVSSVTPNSSRTALMICTQVVAIMPPKSTYASITTPTLITAHS